MQVVKHRCILFIPKPTIGSVFDTAKVPYVSKPVFDEIPSLFTGMDTWIDAIDVLDWHSGLKITGPPKFIATSLNEHGHMKPLGAFASFSTALGYINDNFAWSDRVKYTKLLKMLYMVWHNVQTEPVIIPAPPRHVLEMYCGSEIGLSESDYCEKTARSSYMPDKNC